MLFPDVSPALMTDLYHPDAAYVSWRAGENGEATFDLYTRSAPFGGSYLLVAGLELALDFVRRFRFTDDDLAYLKSLRGYDQGFLDELRGLRFTGDILAMSEGTVAFPNEPLLRVTGPFREAILLESGLLHFIGLSTLLATKAARVVDAARGRPVAEFAFRRAQAPLIVARSAAIAGCTSTSFLGAAKQLGLRASGTIPHALVQFFDTEREAFTRVAESFERYTLLLDTYDVHRAIQTAVTVAHAARTRLGHQLEAVRLDSGDLAADAHHVRGILDGAGLGEVRILASGDLDEFTIAALVDAGAPIDGFGVGTSIGTGAGNLQHGVSGGALGTVYKEVWCGDEDEPASARVKTAGEKSTWPGRKQVYRLGEYDADLIALEDEPPPPGGAPLLQCVIRGGKAQAGVCPPLAEVAARARAGRERLPERYRALTGDEPYPVRMSEAIQELRRQALVRYGPDDSHPPAP
jgi:nicotinate phosphoribosyltransferase